MNQSFGNWVRRRRKALDLTQQALAKRVGCSVSLILKIELDERRPSRQVAELLAEQLVIPEDRRELFLKIARQERGAQTLDLIALPDTPPTVPISNPFSSLPLPLTSFVGREHELGAIIYQLHNSACRLLTLTGPGGVGKTRIALEVAHRMSDSFNHGVYFVSLVGTSSSEFIIPAIASALGFTFSGAAEMKIQLFNYLQEKQIFLVLDNLEHLLDGIELLNELLLRAPAVKLLTTSREQLNLSAEWVFEVQGLPVPASLDLNDLASKSAVALFIQRAQQAKISFTPMFEDFSSITRICQLVEGLPLGIELAATWVRRMSLMEISSEIENNVDFLTASTRDLPARHRSLRTVLDQSWSLLSVDEQQVLMWLSVFRGGFTFAAAKAVAGATHPILSLLMDKSLIRRTEMGRYELHELIRQYAITRLQERPQSEHVAHTRHTNYYLNMLHMQKSYLQSHRQGRTLAELKPELDNIRTAWNNAISNSRLDLIQSSIWSLWYMYELCAYFQEGEALTGDAAQMARERFGQASGTDLTAERARIQGYLGSLLAYQAFFCLRLGRNHESEILFQESISLLRPLGDQSMLAYALAHYGVLHLFHKEYEESVQNILDGLQLSRSINDPWQTALYTTFLGTAKINQGDYSEAYGLFRESLQLFRLLGDPRMIVLAVDNLSKTAQTLGTLDDAQEHLVKSLQVIKSQNNLAERGRLLKDGAEDTLDAGDTWLLLHTLNLEGRLALASGQRTNAYKSFKRAGEVALGLRVLPMFMDALAGLALLETQAGHHEQALELFLYVLDHSATTQYTRNSTEKLCLELETKLSHQKIKVVKQQVKSLTLETIAERLSLKYI